MPTRIIKSGKDLEALLLFLSHRKPPFTVTITDGKHRTDNQNHLQRLWCREIAEQMGDRTPEEVRGYCKLTIGVPILRMENDAFREKYDAIVRPLSYEQKLAIMMEPLDLPVTRIMNTRQKTDYLDGILRHFSEQGVVLTQPGASLSKPASRGSSSPREPSTRAAGNLSTRPRDYVTERA